MNLSYTVVSRGEIWQGLNRASMLSLTARLYNECVECTVTVQG